MTAGGDPTDYQKMDLSPEVIRVLNEDLEAREPQQVPQGNLMRLQRLRATVVRSPPLDPAERETEFNQDFIQSKEDEIVFSRINPHLEAQKTQISLPDQSLFHLLKKNGGVALSPKQCAQQFSTAKQTKKPYHLMNDFEKDTHNFILKLRQEIKAESL